MIFGRPQEWPREAKQTPVVFFPTRGCHDSRVRDLGPPTGHYLCMCFLRISSFSPSLLSHTSGRPKRPPIFPQDGPRGPTESPRTAQDNPRMAQETPRWPKTGLGPRGGTLTYTSRRPHKEDSRNRQQAADSPQRSPLRPPRSPRKASEQPPPLPPSPASCAVTDLLSGSAEPAVRLLQFKVSKTRSNSS